MQMSFFLLATLANGNLALVRLRMQTGHDLRSISYRHTWPTSSPPFEVKQRNMGAHWHPFRLGWSFQQHHVALKLGKTTMRIVLMTTPSTEHTVQATHFRTGA
jgi:hypothetical protein